MPCADENRTVNDLRPLHKILQAITAELKKKNLPNPALLPLISGIEQARTLPNGLSPDSHHGPTGCLSQMRISFCRLSRADVFFALTSPDFEGIFHILPFRMEVFWFCGGVSKIPQ
jgi:hypothetical protein